ncbi:TIGR00730 family Rossman fold protein [Thioalbus denitrificans]|uniref:AMP nucleosidase n=1 Tax=Thioalbus denitrificans TaxID=547122 RepID=A0A369C033_9GAMM|nr:TIGR00730 family Rossman fold protein [Thioalbus denitrificans]RCX26047.1 hypothetical protein DFQ59_11250 [Thioalbus denitrificans]
MTDLKHPNPAFPTAEEDDRIASHPVETPQTRSPSYRLAFADHEFLLREELRPVRMQLELLKPELMQQDYGIKSTIVIFGSARIPEEERACRDLEAAEARLRAAPGDPAAERAVRVARSILAKSAYYDEARKLGHMITSDGQCPGRCELVVITGGGPGIMEAANRGAFDANGRSIGLNIVLPHEQNPNPYITPELSFQFHYFAMRKLHFLLRAKALVAFPGGFGTLDELFETLTLIQTRKVKPVPVLLFGKAYWDRIIDFEAMVEEGTVDAGDLDLFRFVETAEEAWSYIVDFYAGTGLVRGR